MKPVLLECKQLSKKYAGEVIFEKLDLVVMEGEIISFVGPSGCGKTTLLRCIAGLESVSAGQIYLLQDDITQQSARKRPIVLMFQQALLFPHLNVLDNVIYGLRNKRIEKGIQRELGLEMLSKIELDGFAERYPYELSGGQQQRVALARALVVKPKVLLLDEPFSSLDPELRVSLRTWMKRLLKAEGITALFVTHDKEEAMVLGDRVAVMKYGKIQQIGEPTEVYRQPQNEIVADFFCDGMLLEDGRFVPIDQIRILPYESENEPSSVNAQESSTAGQVWHTQEKLRQFSTGMVMGKWWQAGQLFIQLETPDYPKGLTIAAPRDFGVGEKVLIMVKENEDA